MTRLDLRFSVLLLMACDVANEPPAPHSAAAPTVGPVVDAAKTDAPILAAAAVQPSRVAPTVVDAALVLDEQAMRARAEAAAADEVAAGLVVAIGAARGLLATPASPAVVRGTTPAEVPGVVAPKGSPATPKAVPVAPAKDEPRTPSSDARCDLKTFAWGNMRVPIGESGSMSSLKLKNGKHEDQCYWVDMVGPQIADLNGDGADEAYFVVSEAMSTPDLSEDGLEEKACILSQLASWENLYAYELDEKCKPRKIGEAFYVGNCPDNEECADLKLQVRGTQLVYGRERFAWAGGKLTKAR